MKWLLIFCLLLPLQIRAGVDEGLIICENSLETLQWNYEFIEHANYSIELAAYSTGGKIFCTLLEKIEQRILKCPKLQAYVFATPVLFGKQENDLVTRLQQSYPDNFHFQFTTNVLDSFPHYNTIENHMKCLIVDEHFFSIGGTNFHDCLCTEGTSQEVIEGKELMHFSLPSGARDMDIVGRGPIAKKLRHIFYQLYSLWESYAATQYFEADPAAFKSSSHYFSVDHLPTPYIVSFEKSPKLVEGAKMKLCFSGCMDQPNKITKDYAKLIQSAKKEIFIGNFFFVPPKEIYEALLSAVNRDVELNLITNGYWEGSPFFVKFFCWANRTFYVPMFYGKEFCAWNAWLMGEYPILNTHIYEYQVQDVLYHKKVMVVDRRFTVIGSYNLNTKSDQGDYEIVLIIDSDKIAEHTLQVLKRDQSFSKPVFPGEAEEWYMDPSASYVGYLQRLFQGLL